MSMHLLINHLTFPIDSPDVAALAVLRTAHNGCQIMMGHVGAEHAMEFTTLMAKHKNITFSFAPCTNAMQHNKYALT